MVEMAPDAKAASQDEATVKRIRLGVGIIAAALPVLVLVGNMLFAKKVVWLGSISGSYYTSMRGVFVGTLFAMGALLIVYRYQRLDDRWSNVAGGLAIVVALFPTTPDRANGVVTSTQTTIGVVHFTAATLLLLVLAYFCLGVFTRSKSSTTVGLVLTRSPGEAPRKSRRNKIYRVCGWLIVASIVAAGLIAVAVPRSFRESWNTLFWCETVAVVSFAMAWLTKGGAFGWCNDQPTVPTDPN